jgi:pSer/pThr/pTyr-binding forkhead associated (FHA) protein
MPTLRIQLPDQSEATYVLTGERITVGRRPDNTIQILDRSVSAHHAELILAGGHYRLHDLQSTNLSFVDGTPVTDYHLRASCRVAFGNVECDYDATPNAPSEEEPRLTPAQMEKDMAFLRAENQELLNKIDGLQRRIDILSSARLITSKSDGGSSTPEETKKLLAERDELRFQNSGLKLELEKLREELAVTARERDAARQANELLQAEKAGLQRELKSQDKGTTQRISLPSGTPSQPAPALRKESEPAAPVPVEATVSE